MKADVLIVGGGAAGCVLAGRLAAHRNFSIQVLEAGPDYPTPALLPDAIKYGSTRDAAQPGSPHNWALRGTITDEQGLIDVAQGKVIGGGSSINGQAMQRGFPEDFDGWSALGNDEWSYAHVLPYFRRSERDLDFQNEFHGADGPMPVRRRQAQPWPTVQTAFRQACLDLGYGIVDDKNGPNPMGVGVTPSNNLDGVRVSTAIAYLDPVRHQPNVSVCGNVFVRKVLIDAGRAVGVEAETNGEIVQFEADRIVLSAGAIRSPHLLMLSGIGPADHLRAQGIDPLVHSPGVGQNLWNHAHAQLTYRVRDGVSLDAPRDAPRFYLHYTADGSSTPGDMITWTRPVADGRRDRVSALDGRVSTEKAGRISIKLGLPDGGGYVRLASADPEVQPEFNYRYLQHPRDARRMRQGVRMAAQLIESEQFRAVAEHKVKPSDDVLDDDVALDEWIRRTVSTSRHVSGTCRMGPDADMSAVVDQYCRVKGVDGLWVVDASIMPRIPRSGGAHATVIMIAERVVDWIAAA